jgi:hypothetical protein
VELDDDRRRRPGCWIASGMASTSLGSVSSPGAAHTARGALTARCGEVGGPSSVADVWLL